MCCGYVWLLVCIFFFNDTATTEIYTYGHTLSLTTLFRSSLTPANPHPVTPIPSNRTKIPGKPPIKSAAAMSASPAIATTQAVVIVRVGSLMDHPHAAELIKITTTPVLG